MPLRGKSCRCAVLLPVAFVLAAPSGAQAVEPAPHTILVTGPAALDVTNALPGALRKLELRRDHPAGGRALRELTG